MLSSPFNLAAVPAPRRRACSSPTSLLLADELPPANPNPNQIHLQVHLDPLELPEPLAFAADELPEFGRPLPCFFFLGPGTRLQIFQNILRSFLQKTQFLLFLFLVSFDKS